jgi:hypothetical protein
VQPPLLCAGWATFPVLKNRFPLCPMPCVPLQQSRPQRDRGCVQGGQLYH